jgi:hypothetical protein
MAVELIYVYDDSVHVQHRDDSDWVTRIALKKTELLEIVQKTWPQVDWVAVLAAGAENTSKAG